MVLTLSSNWLLRGCVQAAVGTGFCHAIHLLSWSVPRVRECPAVTHARANTSHATRSCCERQGHLQTHDAVEHLIKKLHHIITEVTSKASIWKADYFYHLLEVANENLLWIFSPNLLPRRRLNGLRNLPKVDIKKKRKWEAELVWMPGYRLADFGGDFCICFLFRSTRNEFFCSFFTVTWARSVSASRRQSQIPQHSKLLRHKTNHSTLTRIVTSPNNPKTQTQETNQCKPTTPSCDQDKQLQSWGPQLLSQGIQGGVVYSAVSSVAAGWTQATGKQNSG